MTILNEVKRDELIIKSRHGDTYNNKQINRWIAKKNCAVANTVKDYNKIDMDTFWKKDELKVKVRVQGETDTYFVTINFKNILTLLQTKIIENANKLELKLIYKCLLEEISRDDLFIDCTCPDFKYRFSYYASKNGYKAGEKETRKSDITNPNDTKGAACKHILAVLNNVEWLKKIASVINNYIYYCKDNMEYNYSRYIFPKLYGMSYNKAIQMTLQDFNNDGEIENNLNSSEELINLSNAIGKLRGRFKKKEEK